MNNNYTLLHFSTIDKIILWVGFPLLGLVLGWFLPSIAEWGSALPWLPFQGPLKLIASYSGAWVAIITMIIGLAAGFVLTIFSVHESLETRIYNDKIAFKLRDDEIIIPKNDISLVCMDKKQLILLGNQQNEIFRSKQELAPDKVAAAFMERQYPWNKTDPFEQLFKAWVLDTPDLPKAANALLKAREVAIQKNNDHEKWELAKELWKLQVSVKEIGGKQYYR